VLKSLSALAAEKGILLGEALPSLTHQSLARVTPLFVVALALSSVSPEAELPLLELSGELPGPINTRGRNLHVIYP